MPYLEIPWVPEEKDGDLICVVAEDFSLAPWGLNVTIQKGFRSDGMSVPRFFWRSVGPRIAPKTIGPSIAHDYLYSVHVIGRSAADRWYREVLIGNGYSRIRAYEVWLGVRIGGGSHW